MAAKVPSWNVRLVCVHVRKASSAITDVLPAIRKFARNGVGKRPASNACDYLDIQDKVKPVCLLT